MTAEPYFRRATVPDDAAFHEALRAEMEARVHPNEPVLMSHEFALDRRGVESWLEARDRFRQFRVRSKIGSGPHRRLALFMRHERGNTLCQHGLLRALRAYPRYRRAGWRFAGLRWH